MNTLDINIDKYKEDESLFIINLSGILDADGAYSLDSILEPLIERGSVNLVCRMDGVNFISSTGMGVLLSNTKNIRELGGEMVITGVNDILLDIFKSLDLLNFFTIYPSINESIEYFKEKTRDKVETTTKQSFMDLVTNILSGEFDKSQLKALEVAIEYRKMPEDEQFLPFKKSPSTEFTEEITNHIQFINKLFMYFAEIYKGKLPLKGILRDIKEYLSITDLYFLSHSGKGISIGSGNIASFEFSKNRPLINKLKQSNVVVNINDAGETLKAESLRLALMGCEIVVPVNLNKKVIGLLFLGSKQLGAEYSNIDIVFLKALANLISQIIHSFHTYKRLKEKINH
jgi:anti-anti-sigma factor